MPVPGDQFGDVLGVHVFGAEIQHAHVSLKRHHFIGVDFDHLLGCRIHRYTPLLGSGGMTSQLIEAVFIDVPVTKDGTISPV